jgi:CrcB protein
VTRGTLARVPPRVLSLPRVLVAIFLGGCAGGALRDAVGGSAGRTLLVNLAGSLLLGLLVVAVPHSWRPLLGTGFCGAFTTFGTVMVLADRDLQDGRVGTAAGYLALSLLGGSAAAALGVLAGYALGRRELAPEDPDTEVD